MSKEEIINTLHRFYVENGDFRKEDLKQMGLPSYNTLMRMGISFTDLKRRFSFEAYENSPNKCAWCKISIPYESRVNKFCSRSCSAKSSNRTETPRKRGPPKGTKSSFRVWEHVKRSKIPHTKVRICTVCSKVFKCDTQRKTCSKDCRDSIVKKNRGRHKRSYMEIAFSRWLDERHVEYEIEFQIKNPELNKCYYADFIFHGLNLIIELDGSQHEKTKEEDALRDRFIESLGYKVIRITHKEFQAFTRVNEVERLLGLR